MVKREDLLKIFFVYLCLFHVSPAHPCGRNPISRFRPLTKMLGRDINSLLNLLRSSNPALYQQVQDEWRRYADCVGLVDTGYFKRSSSPSSPSSSSSSSSSSSLPLGLHSSSLLHHLPPSQQAPAQQGQGRMRVMRRMMRTRRRLVAGGAEGLHQSGMMMMSAERRRQLGSGAAWRKLGPQ